MAMRESTMISERRACLLAALSRTVPHYDSKVQPQNEQLQARLLELAGERRSSGYRRLHALVRLRPIRSVSIASTAMPAYRFGTARSDMAWPLSGRLWNYHPHRIRSDRWILSVMHWPMVVESRS